MKYNESHHIITIQLIKQKPYIKENKHNKNIYELFSKKNYSFFGLIFKNNFKNKK